MSSSDQQKHKGQQPEQPTLSPATTRRILKELKDFASNPQYTLYAVHPTSESSLLNLTGTLPGPPGTPYATGTFHLTITLPPTYPFAPPIFSFTTHILHPNVSSDTGAVCLASLKGENWKPQRTIGGVMGELEQLLREPEEVGVLEGEVAGWWREGKEKWEERVRAEVRKHAGGTL